MYLIKWPGECIIQLFFGVWLSVMLEYYTLIPFVHSYFELFLALFYFLFCFSLKCSGFKFCCMLLSFLFNFLNVYM